MQFNVDFFAFEKGTGSSFGFVKNLLGNQYKKFLLAGGFSPVNGTSGRFTPLLRSFGQKFTLRRGENVSHRFFEKADKNFSVQLFWLHDFFDTLKQNSCSNR